jgi:hypothetical protein
MRRSMSLLLRVLTRRSAPLVGLCLLARLFRPSAASNELRASLHVHRTHRFTVPLALHGRSLRCVFEARPVQTHRSKIEARTPSTTRAIERASERAVLIRRTRHATFDATRLDSTRIGSARLGSTRFVSSAHCELGSSCRPLRLIRRSLEPSR